MLASLEPETLLAWCCSFFGMALGGSGVELHRPGCDRCWPCCISSSACSEDRVSGVLRARRACGVRFWRWRRRQGRGRVRVDSVRDGVLLVPSAVGRLPCDHAATSSAVLHRVSYDVGVVPQVQFIDRVLPRCEQRQVPTVAVFLSLGLGCCSTLTRWSMYLGTRLLYGGL